MGNEVIGPVIGRLSQRELRRQQMRAASPERPIFDSACGVMLGVLFIGTLAALGMSDAIKTVETGR